MSTQETKLQAISDAIKAKLGATDTIQASQFASKIGEIPTGVAKPSWVQSTLPNEQHWTSVCYGDGKFVAVPGDSNTGAYSTDGINWTQTTLPVSTHWISVCYGNGKFVAVAGSNNVAAYSTDGINWAQSTLPSRNQVSGHWAFVCYGNGKFVTINAGNVYSGINSTAAYSTDGINWTSVTLPAAGIGSNMIDYCNGKFYSPGFSGDDSIYCSADAINWEKLSVTIPSSERIVSICYGNGKFVAVSDGNTHGSANAVYSTDGINWNWVAMPVKKIWMNVCYGSGKFVAMARGGNDVAAYSTDGVTWYQTTLPVSANWTSVCYGDGKFVAMDTFKSQTYDMDTNKLITVGSNISAYLKDYFDSWA